MWPFSYTDPQEGPQAGRSHEDLDSPTAHVLSLHEQDESHMRLAFAGEELNFLRRIPDEHSTQPRLYERLLVSSEHFSGFGTLTFLSLGSPPAATRLVHGKTTVLQFSAEQPRAFRAVGFPSISPWIHSGNIRCTLSSFPMNASIAFMWSEGAWLAFRGSISNIPSGDIQITSRTSPTDTPSRRPDETSIHPVTMPQYMRLGRWG